jgi:hypothetical protein
MKMKIYHNSFYQLGYFSNFISNVTDQSVMRYVLACQNNDQCHIDKSSVVVQMITSSSESSVIFET